MPQPEKDAKFPTFLYKLHHHGRVKWHSELSQIAWTDFKYLRLKKNPKCVLPKHLLSSSFFLNLCLFQGALNPCVFNAFTFSSLKCYSRSVFLASKRHSGWFCFEPEGVLWSVQTQLCSSGSQAAPPRVHGKGVLVLVQHMWPVSQVGARRL